MLDLPCNLVCDSSQSYFKNSSCLRYIFYLVRRSLRKKGIAHSLIFRLYFWSLPAYYNISYYYYCLVHVILLNLNQSILQLFEFHKNQSNSHKNKPCIKSLYPCGHSLLVHVSDHFLTAFYICPVCISVHFISIPKASGPGSLVH